VQQPPKDFDLVGDSGSLDAFDMCVFVRTLGVKRSAIEKEPLIMLL
jgi:hypothetical protein